MSGDSGPDIVQSYSFTHIAHNRRLSVPDAFSHGEIVSLVPARGGPEVEHEGGTT